MKRIHMMIGIPGSGKTTFVNKFVKENNYKVVSTDIVRLNNKGIDEKEVWPTVYKMIGDILKKEDDVIFDATSITKRVRDRFKENVNNFIESYELIGYFFPTHYSVCEKRIDARNKKENELFLPLEVVESYGKAVYPPMYEEGFSEVKLISNVPDLLEGMVEDGYQGYALYFKEGNDILEEYSGFAKIGTDEPIRNDTNFRLASVTKQFIAYAILVLVNENKLKLEDVLFNIFDDMPEYTKTITIRNLLNHTSGIYDYEDMEHTDKQVQDEDILDFIKGTNGQYFETGFKYQYSNTAYVLLGLIIEKKSGIKLGNFLKEKVFDKFNMTNSQLNYEPITEITPRAYGHLRENGKLVMKDQYWCSATCGDGGIYSSINDLKKWLKNIKNLEKEFEIMEETHIVNGNDIEYGMGIRIKNINGHRLVYHCGSTIGTNTIIGFIDDLDIEFIFLTNNGNKDTEVFLSNIRKRIGNK